MSEKQEKSKQQDIIQETVPEPSFLAQYRKSYPDCKKFHVTGDGLVFLGHEYKKAVAHQKRVGNGELKTY